MSDLPSMSTQKFRGKDWTPIEELRTTFFWKLTSPTQIHLKERALKPMEDDDPPRIRLWCRKRDVSGEHPKGTEILFTQLLRVWGGSLEAPWPVAFAGESDRGLARNSPVGSIIRVMTNLPDP